MTYGDIILRYRRDHGISQRAFAQKCGLSNAYIAMLEINANPTTGKPIKPNIETLKALASAMEMNVGELMEMVDPDSPVVINSTDKQGGIVSTAQWNPEDEGHDVIIPQENRRILDMYDKLNPENQIRLEAYLAGLLDTQQKP